MMLARKSEGEDRSYQQIPSDNVSCTHSLDFGMHRSCRGAMDRWIRMALLDDRGSTAPEGLLKQAGGCGLVEGK